MGVSIAMFVMHGRVPDRINVAPTPAASGASDASSTPYLLMMALCASVILVGVWLSALVAQAIYRLGWKKVEYIYTEREKSFVGITIVFVVLSLCGHLYRAIHGRRGSWMQLQLPFLTLTNSYLALLTHAFWPSEHGSSVGVHPAGSAGGGYGDGVDDGLYDDEDDDDGYGRSGKGKGLLDEDDDD